MTENKWIAVKDKLPEERIPVLLQIKSGRMYVGYYYGTEYYTGRKRWRCITARDSTVAGITPVVWRTLPEKYEEK